MIYLLFIIGFALLVKGADLLVDGAAAIAKRFRVSNIVIGLTIVAFGTSMPELTVNLFASIQGNTEIAIGNIIGSNIANILLILGIAAMIYPLTCKKNTVRKEIPLSLLAALLVGVAANDVLIDHGTSSALTRGDGLMLIAFFIIFMYYTFGIARSEESETETTEEVSVAPRSTTRSVLFILGGLVLLVVGGKWIVDGAVAIATMFGVSQSIIGLTIVAVGTSLPELATSAVAAYKKQSDIAIGNVVGSNIFNIFWILGLSAVIRPLPIQVTSNRDIAMAAIASLILFIALFIGKRHVIERWQGAVMVLMYAAYVVAVVV